MKQATFLLLTLLLTSTSSSHAKEKEQSIQKQVTTNIGQLPPIQPASCSPYPACGDGDIYQLITTNLVDWLKKEMTTPKQSKTAPSK